VDGTGAADGVLSENTPRLRCALIVAFCLRAYSLPERKTPSKFSLIGFAMIAMVLEWLLELERLAVSGLEACSEIDGGPPFGAFFSFLCCVCVVTILVPSLL
jgi:hypothetical protein